MELRRYLKVIYDRIWWVVLCVALGFGAAFITTPNDLTYEAKTTIYVGSQFFDQGDLSQDRTVAIQTFATTFANMIPSEPIARAAVERTGVDRSPNGVADHTFAGVVPGTTLIEVAVTDPDAAVAQTLANGITDAFVERAQELEPGTSGGEGTLPSLPAYVYERAQLPTVPESTSSSSRLVIGSLFGLAIALVIVFLLDYLDITVRTPSEIEARIGLPVLGTIPSSSSPSVLVGARASTRPEPVVQAVRPDTGEGA